MNYLHNFERHLQNLINYRADDLLVNFLQF